MLGAAVLCLVAAANAHAQAPAAETRTVDFWVAGEKGEPVEGLTAEEVAVVEGGAARVVTRLVKDTRPLWLAILVDTSAPLATQYRLHVIEAVTELVRRLPEGTRYALWTTGDRPRRVVDFTEDRAQAARALRKAFPTGGNMLLDALPEASKELTNREAERTAIVVVTGVGIGFASQSRQAVVEDVRRDGPVVMAVQFEETGSSEYQAAGADQVSRTDYDYVLSTLTRESGGVLERPLSAMGTGTALRRVGAALAARYRVTYVADEAKGGKIEVQVARPGVRAHVGSAAR